MAKPQKDSHAAAESLAAAIDDAAASFTPSAIDGVEDAPKRAQMLVALVRARKLLQEGQSRKVKGEATRPELPLVEEIRPMTVAEWEAAHPIEPIGECDDQNEDS